MGRRLKTYGPCTKALGEYNKDLWALLESPWGVDQRPVGFAPESMGHRLKTYGRWAKAHGE